MSDSDVRPAGPVRRNAPVDSANPELDRLRAGKRASIGLPAVALPSGQFKLRCSVKSTGQELGYLGISGGLSSNYVDLVGAGAQYVAVCEWYAWESVTYLRVNNATVYRYLSFENSYAASWRLWNGAVGIDSRDGGLWIAGTNRTLYPWGDDWTWWGNTITNIAIDFIPAS